MTKTKNRRPRIGDASLEGMTLVEIMIVVIIMALIATAVGVAILPAFEKAKINSTQTDAQQVANAAMLFVAENSAEGCPTVDDLIESGYLNANRRTTDAWDEPFQINCDGDAIMATSSGPDRQFGTEDDIE